mgnify:CR=1 FL=1
MTNEERIRAAWQGRISGCLLGKPVEIISMREGPEGLNDFLEKSGSLPLRDYVNYICLLYTSPSPRDATLSRMPSSA